MTTEAAPAPPPAKRKFGGGLLKFFSIEQGFAIPFAIFLLVFFIFFDPIATTPAAAGLWIFIPMVLIFGGYLAITQFLPVIMAPVFESHFATLKDIGVSVWPPIAFGVAALLAVTVGPVTILGMVKDPDLTWIELAIGTMVLIAFALDILMGTVFTSLKNRLASEQGMGRMPGA